MPPTPKRAGNYQVVVSNVRGIATSPPAVLRVAPPYFDVSSGATRMTPQGFESRILGAEGPAATVVYASTNLKSWSPICTNPPVTGPIAFSDPAGTNLSHRFYKVQFQDQP